MEALFLSRRSKDHHFVKYCCLFISLYFCSPLVFCQVEIKMKKTDAIRWETLEGEGQESNIKHFNPRQSSASAIYTLFLSSPICSYSPVTLSPPPSTTSCFFLSAKINISSCLSVLSKMRVGSRALLESFISVAVRVGKETERYDGRMQFSILAHTFLLQTGLIAYVILCVEEKVKVKWAAKLFFCIPAWPLACLLVPVYKLLFYLNTIFDVMFMAPFYRTSIFGLNLSAVHLVPYLCKSMSGLHFPLCRSIPRWL